MNDQKMKKMFVIILSLGFLAFWTTGLEATPKGTLIVADATGEPVSLDPHMHYNTQLNSMLRQVYDTLFERDTDGKLIPGLVESWKNIDETTWQFKLREGVRFHNGDELTTKDVKFSIERIMDPETKSPQIRDCRTVDRIEVIDKYTVNIKTKGPDPILPARFAIVGNVLPEEIFKRMGPIEFFAHPIGAGPFKFVRWDKGKEIVFEANESYYRGSPTIKKVAFKFVSGEKERIEMILKEDAHIVTNVSSEFNLELQKNPKTKLFKKPSLQFYDVFLDTLNSKILADKRVRQALNYTTEANKLIRYLHKGNAKRLATFTMPEEFGYNPELIPYPFDLEKAKILLQKAGFPNGFKVKMLSMEHLSRIASGLKKDWKKLGIEVDIVLKSREEAILKGLIKKEIPFDIFISDPTDPLFDASYQMTIHLDPHHPICRFHNDQIVQLLYESQVTMDEKRRSSLLKKIQEIVLEEAPIVFLYQNIQLYGVNSLVVNFIPYADTMLRLHNISLKEK